MSKKHPHHHGPRPHHPEHDHHEREHEPHHHKHPEPSPWSQTMTQTLEHFEPLEKATQGMLKACEDASNMARDHLDAAVKSASAMSKGLEEISRNAGDLVQESVARSINAGKTMMGCKNAREVMDLHNEFMKDVFDCWVAGTGRISEISARMTQDVMAPITEHATHTMQKITHKASSAAQ